MPTQWGILHQDIKPDNIMIGAYGEVFILDWGAAHIIGDPATETDPVRQRFWRHMLKDVEGMPAELGRLQGTPSFMSPEQAKGQQQRLDERSDIFLLGATLYTMFTLKLPYIGNTVKEVLEKARQYALRPPQARSPEQQIPEEICRIMMKAMSLKPDERYQTVEELAQDLDEILAVRWLEYETRMFHTGETLIQEGEHGDEAYLLLKGNALVTKQRDDTHVVLGVSQRGDIVGEMSLISEEPRSAPKSLVQPQFRRLKIPRWPS
jgi:eukaryotic-like serine/threonine-protein kinase